MEFDHALTPQAEPSEPQKNPPAGLRRGRRLDRHGGRRQGESGGGTGGTASADAGRSRYDACGHNRAPCPLPPGPPGSTRSTRRRSHESAASTMPATVRGRMRAYCAGAVAGVGSTNGNSVIRSRVLPYGISSSSTGAWSETTGLTGTSAAWWLDICHSGI